MPDKKIKTTNQRLNSSIRSLSAYSVSGIDCTIKLDGNESPYNTASEILSACQQQGFPEFNRYPDPGCTGLVRRVSENTGIPREGIVIGNGSDELIQMLIQCYTGGSGTVMVPAPTFSMYAISTRAMGKEVVEVDLDNDFDLDMDKIEKVIDEKDPDLFFLAIPNNPTGNSFSEDSVVKIVESTSGIVVIDEAYYEYSGRSFLELLKHHDNVVFLRTMSKIGFAALRLGILLSNNEIARNVNKVRLPYNINSISQGLACAVYDNYEKVMKNVETVKEERARLVDSLNSIEGVSVYPSDANFLLVDVGDSVSVFNELVNRDILVRKTDSHTRLKNCLRITVGSPEENSALISAMSDIFSAKMGIVDKK